MAERDTRRKRQSAPGWPTSMLQVDGLDLARTVAPAMRESVNSMNVFVHVARTETLRRPEVAVLVDAIHARMADQRNVLLGTAV